MKTNNTIHGLLLALACWAAVANAGTSDLVLYNGFHSDQDYANADAQNNGSGLEQFFFNGGGNVYFVPGEGISVEGTNNSLEMVLTYTGGNNFVSAISWLGTNNASVDATAYASLDFDIHIDPGSASDANGSYGYFHMRFRGFNVFDGGTTANDPVIGDVQLTSTMTNGWQHVSLPIDPTVFNMTQVAGLLIGNDDGWITGINGQQEIYFENIKLVFNTNAPVPPVVKLDTTSVLSGLHMQSASGDPWGRGGVYTSVADWTTFSATTPVTYSMQIKKVPNPATYPYFDFQLLLAPVWSTAYNGWVVEPGFDFDTVNVIWLQVLTTPGNGSEVMLSYKTNLGQGAGDSFMSGSGLLLHYTNSIPAVGLWSLTVSNDAAGEAIFTVTAPDNSLQSATLDATDAGIFAAAMNEPRPMGGWWRVSAQPWDVSFAYQNNNYANPAVNAGQTGVLGGAYVSTVVDGTNDYSLSDNFAEVTLNTGIWQVCSWYGQDAYWTVPVADQYTWGTTWPFFGLQASTNIHGPYTSVPFLSPPSVVNGQRVGFVSPAALPSGPRVFLRSEQTPPQLTAP